MLEYLAIIDFCNNTHTGYDEGRHVFFLTEWTTLLVTIGDEAIMYELRKREGNDLIKSGEITSMKQLRDLYREGCRLSY